MGEADDVATAEDWVSRTSGLGPSGQFKSAEKPEETRSVSEGLFDFSNKPTTRYTTNTSVERHA